MRMRLLICILSLLPALPIFAVSTQSHVLLEEDPNLQVPWFTGPLLTPSASVIPFGHVNFQPYIYFIPFTATYNERWHKVAQPNFYSMLSQNFVMIGIAPRIEFRFIPQLFYQFTQGVRSTEIGDLPIALGFQLLNDSPYNWTPAIKLSVKNICPTGRYQKLNPKKLGTDGAGAGSWTPSISLGVSKLFFLSNGKFFSLRGYAEYATPCRTSVKGVNVYGGTFDTDGKVYPGNTLICEMGMELSITRNWVFAADINYTHKNKTKFFGNAGTFGIVGRPSSEQVSFAPAIEYNWNINVGIITGAWISLAGRNSSCFRSAVTAINCYF